MRDEYIKAPMRTLAKAAGTSLGSVQQALQDLDHRGYQADGVTSRTRLRRRDDLIRATSTTIYGRPPWAELTQLGKLRPTRDDGNTILRERFWDEDLLQLGTSAPALLDYAEMVASGDPRQREAADELRDRETNLT